MKSGQPGPLELRRVLGLQEVTAGGVGIIIGAGIYVLVGAATAEAGAGVWMAFLLAAGLAFLSTLSYMELVSMYPAAAAEYEYTRHAFPEWVAFTVGWIMIAGLIVAAAAISLGFARYLSHFLDLDVRGGAILLLLFVGAVAAGGIKQSARFSMALAAIQIGGLLLVIAIGVPHLGEENVFEVTSIGGVVSAAALVFFAFIGFDEVITLSEETENPTRTVPLALALALGLSTLLYVAVAIAAVSVLGASALGESERPLADVISQAIGSRGGDVMAALAVISTTNTTLLTLTAASRMTYGMAARGALPQTLAYLHPARKTPIAAIAVAAVIAGLFVLLRDLRLVASTTDFAVYVVFLAVNATVVILRFTEPHRARPYMIPGRLGLVPFIPVLGFAASTFMITQLELRAIILGALILALGCVAFWLLKPAIHRQSV